MPGRSLYPADDYRDSCGFGLIADISGQRSHALVSSAVDALCCMTHRGAINADGKTGDGCGLLIQIPDTYLRGEIRRQLGESLPSRYALGMVFLSPDETTADDQRAHIINLLARTGLEIVCWRAVPVQPDALGPIARALMPRIEQFFVGLPGHLGRKEMEARLLRARRLLSDQLKPTDGYVVSLSEKTVVYKGLMMPDGLKDFYTDLLDERVVSAIAVFHQRFSTNTLPSWSLAQPFRYAAHNGEINAISGNRNWAQARAGKLKAPELPDFTKLDSIVSLVGSDSKSLDQMLDILLAGGVPLPKALRMLVPPAWENRGDLPQHLRDYYRFTSLQMEPWDGPAGIVLSDGESAVCLLDRNGLRPARYTRTKSGWVVLASESGVCSIPPGEVEREGRIGPGEMLIVDTRRGVLERSDEVDSRMSRRHPYGAWLEHVSRLEVEPGARDLELVRPDLDDITVSQKRFLMTLESQRQVVLPLAEAAQEGTGSMGDDTPIAVLSQQQRPLYDCFRQMFAQVTNPPIDSLRETRVMSLNSCLGAEGNMLEDTEEQALRLQLDSPILSAGALDELLHRRWGRAQRIGLEYPADIGLEAAIDAVVERVIREIKRGVGIIVLSERSADPAQRVIHALLATGAVHHALIREQRRCDVSILVETASAHDSHQLAMLIGSGASAVCPWLGYATAVQLCELGLIDHDPVEALVRYRRGLDKALLKILSKMGISTLASYRGAQLFEIVGLSDAVVEKCFTGAVSRIGGATFADLQDDDAALAERARTPRRGLASGGVLKYVPLDGESHAFHPGVVHAIHRMVTSGEDGDFDRYAEIVERREPLALRDLLELRPAGAAIAIDEVEPEADILRRFDSAGMSLGALSPEAHEALAEAMNRLGGRSNSGEGGEDEARYGTERSSKIKQVASGRFGVTPHYLRSAEVLQIKIAQGAKPGEGGQLPGAKVDALIARLRYSTPGVTLISPPPHHDIYSIEDLAQLIFDLKQVNPEALVSVKLVACPGVGTVATGVAKAYADLITISGHDGGTGASPLSSIRYAGSPWELGLAEAHQMLCENELRTRVRLQTDGGLKTGTDVLKAAALGAESFGFGTAPMVALGCKYLRICHLNNCATGVATQNVRLRSDHFEGTVERAVNFFVLLARHTRRVMAQHGIRRIEDVIGRTGLLEQTPGVTPRQRHLDLSGILRRPEVAEDAPMFCGEPSNSPAGWAGELGVRIAADCREAVESGRGGEFDYAVRNIHRSIGASLSGAIAQRWGRPGLPRPLTLRLRGTAGQSLAVWNAPGLDIDLTGMANDYVAKGMAGGSLTMRFDPDYSGESNRSSIMGNTCLYGATGGRVFAAGCAGERFAVRNSGARAVIEGAGEHCCEYMTGGAVAVLGGVGRNFGAGMTGGLAFVLDPEGAAAGDASEDVEMIPMSDVPAECVELLRGMVAEHVERTGSRWAAELLGQLDGLCSAGAFRIVVPRGAEIAAQLHLLSGAAAQARDELPVRQLAS
ncbi:MAG: glutamate synthase large subunit [Gammaproteobacteria bacterium AqS3]|nr:glutamate synthase large subunit [Gammaproteobacteria bacterium AqS3]